MECSQEGFHRLVARLLSIPVTSYRLTFCLLGHGSLMGFAMFQGLHWYDRLGAEGGVKSVKTRVGANDGSTQWLFIVDREDGGLRPSKRTASPITRRASTEPLPDSLPLKIVHPSRTMPGQRQFRPIPPEIFHRYPGPPPPHPPPFPLPPSPLPPPWPKII